MKALLRWFDSRMPSTREQWRIHASEYYAPKNWYISGRIFATTTCCWTNRRTTSSRCD